MSEEIHDFENWQNQDPEKIEKLRKLLTQATRLETHQKKAVKLDYDFLSLNTYDLKFLHGVKIRP